MAFNITNGTIASSQLSSGAITVSVPADIQVGDLLFAHLFYYYNSNWTAGMPSGWTLLRQNAGDQNAPYPATAMAYKIAESADTTATDYTFTAANATTNQKFGVIIKITGQKSTSPVGVHSGTANSKTSGTITPADANSLIMILGGSGDISSATYGYSIVTDNPASWTQQYNVAGGGNTSRIFMGYAIRPETTATGDGNWAGDGTTNSSLMVAIYPEPASGPANLKSYNTNLKANIKSINTNLIANIKSLNTNV